MSNSFLKVFLGCIAFLPVIAFAQAKPQKAVFDSLYVAAQKHVEQEAFEAALEAIDAAHQYAIDQSQKEWVFSALIEKAEIMRAFREWDQALEILFAIEGTEAYPRLEARKLDRIAGTIGSISHERFGSRQVKYDSIRPFLKRGIAICEKHNFIKEEASLKNELGMLDHYATGGAKGRELVKEAAALYREANDSLGYVRATINSYREHWTVSREEQQAIVKDLNSYVAGKDCHALKIDLYGMYSYFSSTRGDSLDWMRWNLRRSQEYGKLLQKNNTDNLAKLRVTYETEKIKEEVLQKAEALQAAERRSAELIIYVSILGVLVFGILVLLFRQRTLNKQVRSVNLKLNALNGDLHQANEKYHMLIVESNHRIKNNLQMIISMLQYTSKDLGPDNQLAIDALTSKIHTISALHKHLYADVHNERVNLGTYFKEIVSLYVEISSANFSFNDQIDQVEIRSERIIYFGLIFNELLSNSIEHNQAEAPQISLRIYKQDDNYLFAYEDGEKRPENEKAGMGTQLIAQLIRRIGGQNYEFSSHNGRYQFEFEVDQ